MKRCIVTAIVKTAAKGQVVIPAKLRKKYGITKGSRVEIAEENGRILIKPLLADPVKSVRGMFKEGESALDALIADRSEEAKK